MKQQNGGDLVSTLINLSIPFGLVLAREYVPEVSKALKRLTKKGGSRRSRGRKRKRRTALRNKKRKTIRGGKARKIVSYSRSQAGGADSGNNVMTDDEVRENQRYTELSTIIGIGKNGAPQSIRKLVYFMTYKMSEHIGKLTDGTQLDLRILELLLKDNNLEYVEGGQEISPFFTLMINQMNEMKGDRLRKYKKGGKGPLPLTCSGGRRRRVQRKTKRKQRGGFMRATTRNFCQMKKL
jgi:hypothetical protein